MGRRRRRRKASRPLRAPIREVPGEPGTLAPEDPGEAREDLGATDVEPWDPEEIRRRIAGLRGELTDFLAPYDVFDVVANLWVVNSPFDPDTYQESAQEGLMAVSDYVALLCSERTSRAPIAPGGGLMDAPVIDRIDELARTILGLSDLEMTVRASRSEDPFERLRIQLLSRRMIVQGPGFDFQEEELLKSVFGDPKVKYELDGRLGFGATEGLRIAEAIVSVGLRRYEERRDRGNEIIDLLEDAATTTPDDDEPPAAVARLLRQGTPSERRAARRSAEFAASFSRLGETFQVDATEIAAEVEVPIEAVEAFLTAFSMPLGQEAGSGTASELHRIRNRPLLADGMGNHILVSHVALFWALRPALEESLKDGAGWHRFERARASFVEKAALRYLSGAMRGARSYEGVSFSLEEDGRTVGYEIDGLLIFDTVMFVVEGKSAPLGPASRRGAPRRLRKQLEETLVKAADQTDRARRALEDGNRSFRTAQGEQLPIPERVTEVFPIVVTLENLSELTATIWSVAEAGLLPEGTPTPWALSLYELELICDLTEYPAMLVQFLRRRARLNELRRVHAGDELDWWMHYLERGLYFDDQLEDEEGPDQIRLLSLTDPIDAYYLWLRGDRTRVARKPRQKLSAALRALLDSLRDGGLPGSLEASVALLEFDDRGRREFVRAFRRIRETSDRTGEYHDLSITIDEPASVGITCLAAPGSDLRDLADRLRLLALAKKHQTRLRRWIGLGWCSDTGRLVDVVDLQVGEWSEDQELDALLAEMGLGPSRPPSDQDAVQVIPKEMRRPPGTRGRKP
jgi:hypothetical protein